ncbi:hypothetical protein ABPG74_009832 [Tetrahymena malaccensis]
MRKIQAIKIIIILINYINACNIGCSVCDSANFCQQCEASFDLDFKTGICIFKGCKDNLYYQIKDTSKYGICQAICDQGYQNDIRSNLCVSLGQCSYTFNSQTGMSSILEPINRLQPLNSQQFMLVYSSYINIQQLSTGRYVHTMPFLANLNYVVYFQGSFYIFLLDKTLVKWNFESNIMESFGFNIQGNVDKNSLITQISQKYSILITFDQKAQKTYITLLLDQSSLVNYNSTTNIDNSLNQSYYFCDDFIFLSIINAGIQIQQIIINQGHQITLQQFTNNHLCNQLSGLSILKAIQYKNEQFIVALQNQSYYLILGKSTCQQLQLSQVITKIYELNQETNNYYILQLQTIIQILDSNLNQIALVQSQGLITDSLTIIFSNQLIVVVLINNNQQLQLFNLDIQSQQLQQTFSQQLKEIQAQKLQLVSQNVDDVNQKNSFQIMVYYKYVQSFTFDLIGAKNIQLRSQYFLKPFQRKTQDSHSAIQSVDSNDNSNLVTFCTSGGQVLTWDYSLPMQPKLLDSSQIQNSGSLKSVQFLTDNTVLILSDSNILAFDVIHSQVLQMWPFLNPNSKMVNKFAFSLNGFSYLLYDSCLHIYDSSFILILQNCSSFFDDEIIQAKLDTSFYLIIQKRFIIQVFKVDLNNSQLIQKVNYQSQSEIQIWKIKNLPLSYQINNNIIFELAVFFSDQSLIIFTEQLNKISTFLTIPLSKAVDISFVYDDPYDNMYVVGGLSSSKSALKYTAYAIFKNQANNFYQVIGQSGLNKIFPVYKYLNGNNQIQYGIKSSLVLSYLTAIQNFSFNLQNYENFMDQISISQQVYMSTFQMIKQFEFFTYGDSNGLMTVDTTKVQFYQKVYELDSILIQKNDFIQNVYQSLQMQKYFIIKSNIVVFNLLTNEFIEEINFQNSSSSAISFFQFVDSSQIICLKDNQIFVKNYQTNKFYTYSGIPYVTNYLLDGSLIYLYGSSITILNLQLNEQLKLISDADNSKFQYCFINTIVLICKQESSLIKILNKRNLQTVISFNQMSISSQYSVQVDDDQQRIILYAENIEVYNFNGEFQLSIQSINQSIKNLQIHTKDISILLTQSIQIFDRITYKFRGEILSPGGFKIINYSYIPLLNQLAFYLESVNLGQIFTVSLDTLAIVMKFTSTYSQNQPSQPVTYHYDKDQNLFILLDQAVEYDNKSQYKILGFDLDFKNNYLFIFSQTQVFKLCFGDLNKPVIKFQTYKKKFFSQVNQIQSAETNIDDNSFIIAGDQGLLYKYQNTAFEYFSQLNEEIQAIIYDQNNQLLIIALFQSLIVYQNFNQNSLNIPNTQQNSYDTINLNSPFLSFICSDIFITKDRQIYHYDFINKKIVKQILLDSSKLYIRKQICSTISNYVFLGLSNGDVIIYKRDTYQSLKISLIEQHQGQIYNNLQIGELIETSTDLWICFPSNYGVFRIKLSDLSYSQIIQFSDLKTYYQFKNLNVMIFDVDQLNNRLFLSFVGESLLRVIDFQGNLFSYISLPGMMYNKIKISKYYILAYTTFHIMIYDRVSLVYISSIRRNNFYDFIVDIEEVLGQYILLLTETKYEMFYINQGGNEANLMDQIQIQSATFMKVSLNSGQQSLSAQNNSLIMQVLLLSQSQVYEQRYNLKFESIQDINKVCTIDISVNSQQDITLIMDNIKPVQYSDIYQRTMIPVNDTSNNNQWDISLQNNDLRNINYNGTLNSNIQVQSVQTATCSQNLMCQSLQIYQDSFLSFKKQIVQIRDFNFQFQYFQGNVQFFRKSEKVIFDNIQISLQNLTNISFQFNDMKEVILNKINITNNLRLASNQINSKNDFFLFFENIQEVYLYNLVIDNQNQKNISLQGMIGAKNVSSITISNLSIKNSYISVLINIVEVQNLIINNVQIINCSSTTNSQNTYILNTIGVFYSSFSDIFIQNNNNLLFIFTTNIIQEDSIQKNLQNDQIILAGLQILNNQIKYSNSQSLLSIKNSYSSIINTTYQFNQGNIVINQSIKLTIQSSIFQQNSCLNGGALFINSSQNIIQLYNTTFFQNLAFASGGAIFLENVNAQLQMDNKVVISQNYALIGGGLRLFNKQSNYPQKLDQDYKKLIFNNNAELYGKDFASFIQTATIGVVQNYTAISTNTTNNNVNQINIEYKIILQENMNAADQQKYQKILQIFNFQSGGEISLFVKLIDSEGTYLNFSLKKFQQGYYPTTIIEELKLIQFKIQPITLDQNVIIGGHNIITIQNFDEKNNQFMFNQIKISSMPNQTTYLALNLNTLQSVAMLPIQLQIKMRICLAGEIVQIIGNNIYSCYPCPSGQYSLADPTQDQFWYDNISKQDSIQIKGQNVNKTECLKCPDSTQICQNNTIILKKGYWRSNQNSSEIIQCSSIFNACDDQDKASQHGCIRGYIGPACRSCDINGQVWQGEKYSQSYYNQMNCGLCSALKFNIVVIVIAILSLILYFFLSTNIFIDSFTHSTVCLYLRKAQFIPISKNQIKDQSSFYLKILINYIQISCVMIASQPNIFPDILEILPNFMNDPNQQISISVNCLVNQSFTQQYSAVHTTQVLQAILPIIILAISIFLVLVLKMLKVLRIKKFHIYTLINLIFVFFQPNQINFFSKQLTCTQIGSQFYVSSDLTIQCGDEKYIQFTKRLAIPLIIAWSFCPLIILFYLSKRSKNLQTCFTIFYFGYYYQEYKDQYYFWEFIRTYIRVIIVVTFTLTSQSQLLSFQITLFILFLYIMASLYLLPTKNNHLQKFDLLCYLVLAINSTLSTFNQQLNYFSISILIYCLHYGFMLIILLAIILFKINNPLTIFGRIFSKILLLILPTSLYIKFYKTFKTNWKTFVLWKKIYKNLQVIIQIKALQNFSQEQLQLQQNQKNLSIIIQKIQSQSPQQNFTNHIILGLISGCGSDTNRFEEDSIGTEIQKSGPQKVKIQNKIHKNDESMSISKLYQNQIESKSNNIEESLGQLNVDRQNLQKVFDQNYETKFKMKKKLDFDQNNQFKQKFN